MFYCANCCKQLEGSQKKFCSLSCQRELKVKIQLEDWHSGKYIDNRVLSKLLKMTRGNYCQICGLSDWNGKEITLEVEHINGNSEDSKPSNVCLICPNCHSQTPTYKGRNKGNGRYSRRERYKIGKSF